jgi:hypothetical protein
MTRLTRLALVSLTVLAACASKNNASSNPDAGNFDGYYSEVGGGGSGSGGSGGSGTVDPDKRPKPQTVTATKGAPPRKGKSIAARKPAVGGGGAGKPRPRPQPAGTALELAGYFPTNAPKGSVIEILGAGFIKDKTTVTIGKQKQKVIEYGDGHMLVQVSDGASGPLVLRNPGTRGAKGKLPVAKAVSPFHTVSIGTPRTDATHGLVGNVYRIASPVTELPAADTLGEPFATFAVDNLDIPAGNFDGSFKGVDVEAKEWFAVHFRGSLNITEAGSYQLCLNAGDGALLFLDQTPIIDNDGVHDTTEKCETLAVEPGEYQLDVMWFQAAAGELGLQLTWAKDGGAKAPVPRENLFPPEDVAAMARK